MQKQKNKVLTQNGWKRWTRLQISREHKDSNSKIIRFGQSTDTRIDKYIPVLTSPQKLEHPQCGTLIGDDQNQNGFSFFLDEGSRESEPKL